MIAMRKPAIALVFVSIILVSLSLTSVATVSATTYSGEEGHWYGDDYGWGRITINTFKSGPYYKYQGTFDWRLIRDPMDGYQIIDVLLYIVRESDGATVWSLRVLYLNYFWENLWNPPDWRYIGIGYWDIYRTYPVGPNSGSAGWYVAQMHWLIHPSTWGDFPTVRFYLPGPS